MPIPPIILANADATVPAPGEINTFNTGLDLASVHRDKQADINANRLGEKAKVKRWFEVIDAAREFDRAAYAQLAIDRAYARGDSSFRTRTNLIGSFINTWVGLLYAKKPDVDVTAAETVGEKDLTQARLFGDTMEIVINKLWAKAKMKDVAKTWVRAGLTSYIGWLKVTWQERAGTDPITDQAISDLQDNLASVQRSLVDHADDAVYCDSAELQAEELRLAIKGLEEKAEQQIRKGLCIDLIDMADITISQEAPSVARYLDSPWISHRTYLRMHQARALFPDLTTEDLKNADTYGQKKPTNIGEQSGSQMTFSAEDANAYEAQQAIATVGQGMFVCAEEVWDRDTNQIFTLIRGLETYARKPYSPTPATTRFYGFFGLIFTAVDGQRWPQSLNQRSQTLQDAYSRAISAFEEHRARIKPKTAFQAGMMDEDNANKLASGGTQEMVAIKTTDPKMSIKDLLYPVAYAAIDMGAYDTGWIMRNMELIWGLQDAMQANADASKTATAAEIEQKGTESRSADKRDDLEDVMSDIAQHTAEIALQMIDQEEVRELAGVEALWPTGIDPEELDQIGVVTIRAGSSGKPNSRQQREVWSSVMPMIQGLMQQIATLRQSNPLDVADCLEALIEETAARSGEQLDPTRFIPVEGQPVMLIDPKTLQPVMAFPSQLPPPAQGPGGPPIPGGPAVPGAPPMSPPPGGGATVPPIG